MSWTVPLRHYEARLLDIMFAVLRARAGQRVSRARWLVARAHVLLQDAAEDGALSPYLRDSAKRALDTYRQEEQDQAQRLAARQTAPSWEVMTR